MHEFDNQGVMKWERLIDPVFWPAANAWVIADRHLPDGTREHMVQGSVKPGTVIGNANVIGEQDVHNAQPSSTPSHITKN